MLGPPPSTWRRLDVLVVMGGFVNGMEITGLHVLVREHEWARGG